MATDSVSTVERHSVAVPDPVDSEYTTSFSLKDAISSPDGFLTFFKANGFVVVRDAVSSERIDATVEEVKETVCRAAPGDVDWDDPTTWGPEDWPVDDLNRGFIDVRSPFLLTEAWRNLQQPAVVQVWRLLLGKSSLLTKRPRYGVMRPTQSPGSPDFVTAKNWLHVDRRWAEPEEEDLPRLQGMLILSDHTPTSGGFECVPGFASKLSDWFATTTRDPSRESFGGGIVMIPEDDVMQADVAAVTMRPGSLIVWDSRTPHCSYPNQSSGFRMVQYIALSPASDDPDVRSDVKARLEDQLRRMHFVELGEFPGVLTDLGRRLVGLDTEVEEDQ